MAKIIQPVAAMPDATKCGGKAAGLLRLKKAGLQVPEFIIIPVDYFVDPTVDKIKGDIELQQEIEAVFSNGEMLAVRSSATVEDAGAHSFAGQFLTVLNVSASNVLDAVAAVWQSSTAGNVQVYKQQQQIEEPIQMAVVIQQMIDADMSGVAFGINPITEKVNEKLINAVYGLGDGLVNGSKLADSYFVSETGILKNLLEKESILTDKQIMQIAGVLDKLTETLSFPQDIEFAFKNDQLYLLQCRPVTTIRQPEIIWDNSNIIESYPGLTLPLTFSFIEKMYESVYRQFSAIMGVSTLAINSNKTVYASMLGLLNGRVYYNLNSWFTALANLPGYSLNANFMEKMMGVKEKFDGKITVDKEGSKMVAWWHVFTGILSIVKNLRTARKQKDKFIIEFDLIYNKFDKSDFSQYSLKELRQQYTEFEQMMVSKWKAPLVNDFFAMIYTGLLQKLCVKHFPGQISMHNNLVAASKDVATTAPLTRLPAIAKLVKENTLLANIFANENPAFIWQTLRQPAYNNIYNAIQKYLHDWGERCPSELKLETITYVQEPTLLVEILQAYLRQGIFSFESQTNQQKERTEAELLVNTGTKRLDKLLFKHVLKHARYFISNRENLRYYRTKGFGMVRRMLLAMGNILQQQKVLKDKRDVFYLKLPELLDSAENGTSRNQLEQRVTKRKNDYSRYIELSLPERIITKGQPPRFLYHTNEKIDLKLNSSGSLQGTACSAGVVRAKAKLVYSPADIDQLNGCILVAHSTDPGWVVLFPSAVGILTERGSVLSHAAIVSREMGIPCVAGIANLMQIIKDGEELLMDGSTGLVKVISG